MGNGFGTREVMKLWAQPWETYLRTLQAAQDQGDRVIDLMIGQNPFVPEDARKVIKEWTANGRRVQQVYLDIISQNLKRAEEVVPK